MELGILELKRKVRFLESKIEKQTKCYINGYTRAMKDCGYILEDTEFEDLTWKYQAELYEKAVDKPKKRRSKVL